MKNFDFIPTIDSFKDTRDAMKELSSNINNRLQTLDTRLVQLSGVVSTFINNAASTTATTTSTSDTSQSTGAFALTTATAQLVLTTSDQNIPGATLTLPEGGLHLVVGNFRFTAAGVSDIGNVCFGVLTINGFPLSVNAVWVVDTNASQTMAPQVWLVSGSAGDILQLVARKGGGTGSSIVDFNTTIATVFLG